MPCARAARIFSRRDAGAKGQRASASFAQSLPIADYGRAQGTYRTAGRAKREGSCCTAPGRSYHYQHTLQKRRHEHTAREVAASATAHSRHRVSRLFHRPDDFGRERSAGLAADDIAFSRHIYPTNAFDCFSAAMLSRCRALSFSPEQARLQRTPPDFPPPVAGPLSLASDKAGPAADIDIGRSGASMRKDSSRRVDDEMTKTLACIHDFIISHYSFRCRNTSAYA